jgi:hypothetical protein
MFVKNNYCTAGIHPGRNWRAGGMKIIIDVATQL